MYRIILLVNVIALTSTLSTAEPGINWMQTYDSGADEGFYDIYAVAGGGYIMCGHTTDVWPRLGSIWLVRINDEGEIIWEQTYDEGNSNDVVHSIIETDDGNFLVGGQRNGRATALLVDQDGDEIWWNDYRTGRFRAVIELKSGEFALTGGSNDTGYLIMINGDGDVLWERQIDCGGSRGRFTCLRETNGGIVTAGHCRTNRLINYHIWIVKVDMDGETVWTRFHWNDHLRMTIVAGLVSSPNGGFATAGIGTNREGDFRDHFFLHKVNNQGQQQWAREYERQGTNWEYCEALVDMDAQGGYALVGRGRHRDQDDRSLTRHPLIIRTNNNGQVQWRATYFDRDQNQFGLRHQYNGFNSVVVGHDGGLIAAGSIDNIGDSTGQDGFVMKLEPEQLEPIIFYWSPEDTVFSIFSTDTTEFIVRARDQQGDEFGYTWIMGEDTLGHDSTVTKIWENVGEYVVQCQASDGENVSRINWHVEVADMYIDSFQPDTLNPSTRRNSTIDFSVTTRAIEDDPVEYQWLLNDEQIAENDSVSIRFERGREHSVTAIASQGVLADSVTWQVLVNDLIVDYMPEQLELSVEVDTTFEFEVFPFDPNDDSLTFLWTLDGDSISDNSWVLVNFDTTGVYDITAYVSDTTESDSLTWTIDVTPNSVYSDDPRHPDTPVLYPAVPNPFNSTTTVRYYLPTGSQVRLSLFDVQGRLVVRLVNRFRTVGEHLVVIEGNDLVSGVYFVRMVADDFNNIRKIVLIQ